MSHFLKKLLRKLRIRDHGKNNTVKLPQKFKCNNALISIKGNNNIIEIEENFAYISIEVESFGGKDNLTIDVGNRTTFMNTHITCFEDNSSVIIGEDCIFSYDTVLYNTDGHPIYAIDGDEPLNRASHIKLGNHLWIAHSAVVLKNVELADNIIIGRNALVTKSFMQKNCVLAGLPAKIVKENVRWELQFPKPGQKSKYKGLDREPVPALRVKDTPPSAA